MLELDVCRNCGSPQNTPECVFCTPSLFPSVIVYKNPYINHCWNCAAIIDSRVCKKSLTVGMGYHCSKCGEDLTKWKNQILF